MKSDLKNFTSHFVYMTQHILTDFFSFSILELQQITDKIDLPLYDFVTGNDGHQSGFTNKKVSKTEELLMEFDSIYDAVELSNLTPPQTPPQQIQSPPQTPLEEEFFLSGAEESQQFAQNIPDQSQFIFEYQQQSPDQEQYIYDVASPSQEIIMYENSNQSMISCEEMLIDPEPIISSPADIQRELEVVHELIEAHSRSQSELDEQSSTYSPSSEYQSSVCSQDDEPVRKSSSLRGVTKKRTRPYGRQPEEKKSRKKEQNKNAATRYRQKKKEEVHVIMGEERVLMDKNQKLSTTFSDTRREVKYLKSLLKELFVARGFIQWKHFLLALIWITFALRNLWQHF